MDPQGYYIVPLETGLWENKTRRTEFCLYVNDFGVKYFTKDDANHLLDSLLNPYKISTDWGGNNYLGLTIDWNYSKEYVDI